MGRPSDPLLRWLRKLLSDRKLTAPALASQASLERGRVRAILSGQDAMTVDELLAISKALSLSPADLGAAGLDPAAGPSAIPAVVDGATPLHEADASDDDLGPDADVPTVSADPLGNHPRSLFQLGFALQCDFLFLANADALTGSGVPIPVLQRYKGALLPIKLDAEYHQYNAPKYEDDAVTLTLSFDAVYDCRFPWTAIKEVHFHPAPPDQKKAEPEPPSEPEPPPPPKKGKPFLRLVE